MMVINEHTEQLPYPKVSDTKPIKTFRSDIWADQDATSVRNFEANLKPTKVFLI